MQRGEITANMYFDDPYVENLFITVKNVKCRCCFHIGPTIGGCYGLVDSCLPRLEKELDKFPDYNLLATHNLFGQRLAVM